MLCVLILYISLESTLNCRFQFNPNDRFCEELFLVISFTFRLFARNLLRRNRRKNTFRISSWCLAWGSNPGFSSWPKKKKKKKNWCVIHSKLVVCIYINIARIIAIVFEDIFHSSRHRRNLITASWTFSHNWSLLQQRSLKTLLFNSYQRFSIGPFIKDEI